MLMEYHPHHPVQDLYSKRVSIRRWRGRRRKASLHDNRTISFRFKWSEKSPGFHRRLYQRQHDDVEMMSEKLSLSVCLSGHKFFFWTVCESDTQQQQKRNFPSKIAQLMHFGKYDCDCWEEDTTKPSGSPHPQLEQVFTQLLNETCGACDIP